MRHLLARRLLGLLALLIAVAAGASGLARAQGGQPPAPAAPFVDSRPPYQPRASADAPAPAALPAAQGTLRSFGAVADAEVREGEPAANFGIAGMMGVGFADVTGDPRFGGKIRRALLHFDLASALPPGTTVHQALLQVTVQSYCDYDYASRLTAYSVSEPWSEGGVTWATQPASGESHDVADIPIGATGAPFSFDLTALAQAWVSGQQPEHGVLLRGPEAPAPPADCAFRGFYSRGGGDLSQRPRLVVDYTLPAPALAAPGGAQALARAACAAAPAPRAVAVASNQAALADWRVAVSGGEGWLTAAPALGRVSRIFPDVLTLAVAPGAPCDRDLQALVTLEAPGLAPASFTVTLDNPAPGKPALPRRAFLPAVATGAGAAPAADLLFRAPLPAADAPARVAIVVGVSDYKFLEPPTDFSLFRLGAWGADLSESSVDAFAIALELEQLPGFQRIVALREADATLENIQFAFEYFDEHYDSEEAELLLFVSGHGAQTGDTCPLGARGGLQCRPDEADGKDELYAPFDANQTAAEGFTGVLLDDELKARIDALQSRNVAVIADACNSGGLDAGGPGHSLLAASAEDQLSWESSEREHGVFTSFLLEAMRDPAHDRDQDGCLSLSELHLAVRGPVKSYIKAKLNVDQDVTAQIGPDVCVAPLGAAGQ